MAAPTILPPLTVTRGLPASFAFVFRSQYPDPRSPVDLSDGWTGTFTISDELGGEEILSQAIPDLGADGMVLIHLTAEQTEALTASRHIGGRVAASYQITLNYEQPDLSQVWQGALSIAEAAA